MALHDDSHPWPVSLARLVLWVQAAISLLSTCVLAALWNGLAGGGFPNGLIAVLLSALLTAAVADIASAKRLGSRSRSARYLAITVQTLTMAAMALALVAAQNAGSGGLICLCALVFGLALTVVLGLSRPSARSWLIY
ncbi:hypothetical protein AB0I28_25475 [Phytomonospora sp. NPDC050363]|uniref:hypothetical protein n=1 Tax=Phytomonospora sp. NPDC050363 TaxID=3155642 RepID=UPI0033D02804